MMSQIFVSKLAESISLQIHFFLNTSIISYGVGIVLIIQSCHLKYLLGKMRNNLIVVNVKDNYFFLLFEKKHLLNYYLKLIFH